MKTNHVCRICGGKEESNRVDETAKRLIDDQTCFDCDFWMERVPLYTKGLLLVINGCCFSDGGRSNGPKKILGYGGREFSIKKKDGTVISTNNLWRGGKIPERFKNLFPDNADFI